MDLKQKLVRCPIQKMVSCSDAAGREVHIERKWVKECSRSAEALEKVLLELVGWIYTAWFRWPNSDLFIYLFFNLLSGTDGICNINLLAGEKRMNFDIVRLKSGLFHRWYNNACSPGRQLRYSLVLWVVRHWKCRSMLHKGSLLSPPMWNVNCFVLFCLFSSLTTWWTHSGCFAQTKFI